MTGWRTAGAGTYGRRPTRRPKTNFSVGCVGSVVVPSCADPASLVTAGIAKYWNVIVVSPGRRPESTWRTAQPWASVGLMAADQRAASTESPPFFDSPAASEPTTA